MLTTTDIPYYIFSVLMFVFVAYVIGHVLLWILQINLPAKNTAIDLFSKLLTGCSLFIHSN